MAFGFLDLSIVTDRLVALMKSSITSSTLWSEDLEGAGPPFGINVTGLAPDAMRKLAGCQVSAYLFHVAADSFWRNTPVSGPRAQTVPSQPLSLDLFYLLTAYSENSYVEEQQAMSVALKCFHENPFVTATVPIDGRQVEFTLTMASESADERSRLWQAITSSLRLSAVYRVAVAFLEPPPPPLPAPKPTTWTLTANPAALPAGGPLVIGTTTRVRYVGPDSAMREFDLSPATVTPGQGFLLLGNGLGIAAVSDRLYLVPLDGSPETDVTAWMTPAAGDSRLAIALPAVGAPPPGVWQLRTGNAIATGSPGAIRSNATPFSVAARIDPAGGPLVSGTPIAVTGGRFVAGATEVLLDSVSLAATGGAPAAGQFQHVDDATLHLLPPATLPTGTYTLRVRVAGVESPPAKWVVVP